MKVNLMLRGASLVALGALLFETFPTRLGGQAASSPPHDLSAQVKAFSNYSKDFRALEGSLHGEEWQEVDFLDGIATTAAETFEAANTMLDMYDSISCKPDRAKVRPILKKHLDYYSRNMDWEADRSAGSLQFAKVPAVAQMGLRMKDDLRAAKEKLDAIGGSLD